MILSPQSLAIRPRNIFTLTLHCQRQHTHVRTDPRVVEFRPLPIINELVQPAPPCLKSELPAHHEWLTKALSSSALVCSRRGRPLPINLDQRSFGLILGRLTNSHRGHIRTFVNSRWGKFYSGFKDAENKLGYNVSCLEGIRSFPA